MERYIEYKDSGVKWLGEIPSHWEVKRLRAALTERKERYSNLESLMILSLIKDKGIIPYDEKGDVGNKSKDDHTQYKVARKGDLVINSMNVIIGSFGITPYDGYISPAYYSFKPCDEVNLTYYNYILSLRRVQQSIRCFSKGIMEIRLKISAYDFLSMPFPFPTLKEQETIANYLNTATSKIDEAIAQQQKMIDLLNERKQIIINNAVTKGLDPNVKMKPSGVDWIGDIPEHWEVIRIKYLLRESKGRSVSGNEEPLSMSQVYGLIPTQKMDIIPNMASSFVGAKLVNKGDLVFNKLKAHLGVFNVSKYDGLVSPDYAVYSSLGKVNLSFLEYIFKTPKCINEFIKLITGVGAGLSRLYTSDLYSIYCALPPFEEQDRICCTIDEKTTKIKKAIENALKQISLLQERKQIIINDVVTGKVKVI